MGRTISANSALIARVAYRLILTAFEKLDPVRNCACIFGLSISIQLTLHHEAKVRSSEGKMHGGPHSIAGPVPRRGTFDDPTCSETAACPVLQMPRLESGASGGQIVSELSTRWHVMREFRPWRNPPSCGTQKFRPGLGLDDRMRFFAQPHIYHCPPGTGPDRVTCPPQKFRRTARWLDPRG